MKVNVYSIQGEVKEEIELPAIFNEEYRPDLIKRAVLSAQSARIQPWGNDPMAGKRTSAESWGSGRGAAMVPRIKSGRKAHPVRAEKNHHEKVNNKERRFAIRLKTSSKFLLLLKMIWKLLRLLVKLVKSLRH